MTKVFSWQFLLVKHFQRFLDFVGGGDLKNNCGVAIRPWPLSIGPQVKIGRLTFSFEIGNNDEASFYAGLISTVGFRWPIK